MSFKGPQNRTLCTFLHSYKLGWSLRPTSSSVKCPWGLSTMGGSAKQFYFFLMPTNAPSMVETMSMPSHSLKNFPWKRMCICALCIFSSFFPIHMIQTLSMPSHSLKKFPWKKMCICAMCIFSLFFPIHMVDPSPSHATSKLSSNPIETLHVTGDMVKGPRIFGASYPRGLEVGQNFRRRAFNEPQRSHPRPRSRKSSLEPWCTILWPPSNLILEDTVISTADSSRHSCGWPYQQRVHWQ